jgi:hypothetical protein
MKGIQANNRKNRIKEGENWMQDRFVGEKPMSTFGVIYCILCSRMSKLLTEKQRRHACLNCKRIHACKPKALVPDDSKADSPLDMFIEELHRKYDTTIEAMP